MQDRKMQDPIEKQRVCRHERQTFAYVNAATGRLKMREWKMRYGQNCKGGKSRSKPYGTPTRDYIETVLSYFVILVIILLTEKNCDFYCIIKIVAAFVFVYWWIVSCGIRVCNFLIISNTSLQSK